MDTLKKKPSAAVNGRSVTTDAERRRIGRIVHDDRGNASVDWLDAPTNYQRQVFEIEEESGGLSIQKPPQTFDPYSCDKLPETTRKAAGPKKDLRKLSEWIKMMRDLEERKRKGEIE
jgi:hypothetical protein